MRRLASFCLFSLLSLAGLSCTASVGPPLAVHVDWLDSPTGTIPTGVTQLTVLVYIEGMADPQSSINTVANLDDMDGNGQPELVRGDLPTGVPIRITIEGQTGGTTSHVGHAGPFTLQAGERRYVDLQMYPVGSYATADAGTAGSRMLATATALSDGRVLIAGGFTRATAGPCPTGIAAGATCFDLTAAGDALIFDVASGTFFPVQGGLLHARGGHSATLLPGDRVLLAGGASHAVLALVPGTSAGTYDVVLQSLDTSAATGASFEIFTPDANAEEVDTGRDGDPGRGGLVGAADAPTMLGRLNSARFMHAAVAVPGHPSQVLLVGGIESPDSYELFDDARAGGYGVLDSTGNQLAVARPMPTAVALHGTSGDAIWILGGTDAASNDDLAEVWTASTTTGSGSTVAATMRDFPDAAGTDRPELALVGATATQLDATHAVVVGWYGPLCDASGMPAFSGVAIERCDFPVTGSRSYTLNGATGTASTTSTHTRHAFGAAARLDDGSVLVTGGVGARTLVTANSTEHFQAMVPTGGSAQLSDFQPILAQGRAFHAMAALPDGGAIVVGGINIDTTTATVPTARLLMSPEVVYLPRP